MEEIKVRNVYSPKFDTDVEVEGVPEKIIGSIYGYPIAPADPEFQPKTEQYDDALQLQDAIVDFDELVGVLHAAEDSFESEYEFSYAVSIDSVQLMDVGTGNLERFLRNFDERVPKVIDELDLNENIDGFAVKPLGSGAFVWMAFAGLGGEVENMNAAVGVTFNKKPFKLEQQVREFYTESPLPTPYSYHEVEFDAALVSGRYHFEPKGRWETQGSPFVLADNFIPSSSSTVGKRASGLDWVPLNVKEDELDADEYALSRVDLVDVTGNERGILMSTLAFEPL